ncbi:MAG: DUF192 domain-containing protein [Candidatus Aenigmarchaeota archaeon]|nr:DUF192 domain-containing protein [Candidatus Aenigmarchaeota archaeon]
MPAAGRVLNTATRKPLCEALEVARTPAQRARGLMFRSSLQGGLLFRFPAAGRHRFWTVGMRFPIDILWLDPAGRVVHLKEHAQPWRFAGGPPAPASQVLELPAGRIASSGTRVGHILALPVSRKL